MNQFLDLIEDEQTVLEAKPLETAASTGSIDGVPTFWILAMHGHTSGQKILEEQYESEQVPRILKKDD